MTDIVASFYADMQTLADELSTQARHIEAQRFVVQCLYVALLKNGNLESSGMLDPVRQLAVAAYGAQSQKPRPELLEMIFSMTSGTTAEIIAFPSGQ